MEKDIYGAVSRGGLQNRLSGSMPFPLKLWLLQKQLNPNTLSRCFCALHRKSAAERCFDGSLEQQQTLCYKRPLGTGQQGYVCTTTGSTVVPKMCEGISGIAQFLGCKGEVISLPSWTLLSCNYWGGNGVCGGVAISFSFEAIVSSCEQGSS